MNPKRWRQIESLYQSALDLDPRQRDALLGKACAGDEELRREVESLLRHLPDDNNFRTGAGVRLATPSLALGAVPSFVGREIGSYKVWAAHTSWLTCFYTATGGVAGRFTVLLASGGRTAWFQLDPHQDGLGEIISEKLGDQLAQTL